MQKHIPKHIHEIAQKLEDKDFEVFVVGGSVRDLLLGKLPKDWDLTTDALPVDVMELFPDGKSNNDFGTVLLPIRNEQGVSEEIVEITTYRSEQGYTDRRHPDVIQFEKDLELDLARRDFTVNAMALRVIHESEIVDIFGGQKDVNKKIVRAVGEPTDRFKEDALRMLRAVRFSCQLGFEIEPKTERAILKMAGTIKFVSTERIREELIKILESDHPYEGIMSLHRLKLLNYILPELERGLGVMQNHHHVYDIFKHNVLSLKYCPSKDWRVRLAALLHDVGKVQVKRIINGEATFYNHEYVSAKIAQKICKRLKFSLKDEDKVVALVKNHMFYYNVGEVTASSVRRLLVKTGKENLQDLIHVRIADRLGSGVKKGKPYKLRHLEYMLEKVQHDPVSVKDLKLNGDELMQYLDIKPSPKIGQIFDVMLAEVIEDPELNTKEQLLKRSKELNEINLEDLRRKAKEAIEEKRVEDDNELKKDFHVN